MCLQQEEAACVLREPALHIVARRSWMDTVVPYLAEQSGVSEELVRQGLGETLGCPKLVSDEQLDTGSRVFFDRLGDRRHSAETFGRREPRRLAHDSQETRAGEIEAAAKRVQRLAERAARAVA